MILLIDTTKNHNGRDILRKLSEAVHDENYELIDTTDKDISHCIGCKTIYIR